MFHINYNVIIDILQNIQYTYIKYKINERSIGVAKIGYARVSTKEQNEARQLAAFSEHGVNKIFVDKQSGKDTNRPQLKAMLEYVREGDTVIVTEFSRLARSTKDLLHIVEDLQAKDVQLVSLKEQLDTSSSTGKFMLTVFAALSELERATILDSQREGIALAKAAGKYKGRQPLPFNEQQFRRECDRWLSGEQTAVQTMQKCDMKPNRFYRKVAELNIRGATNG